MEIPRVNSSREPNDRPQIQPAVQDTTGEIFARRGSNSGPIKGCELERTTTSSPQRFIKISFGGKSYNLNKTIELRINNVTTNLTKAEESNGFIGRGWSGFKNLTGIGDSSDKVRERQEVERNLLTQFNSNPSRRAEIFKSLTGFDYTPGNLQRFIKGEIKLLSEQALVNYLEGQGMAVDVISDIGAGVAGAVAFTAVVLTAPVSGPALVVGGTLAAATTGAVTKVAIKHDDAVSGGNDYTLNDAANDFDKGVFTGALAPVSMGVGSSARSAVTAAASRTALSESATNALAFTAETVVDGAVGGGLDNGYRTALEGGSVEEVLDATLTGAEFGAVAGPVLGWTVKGLGAATRAVRGGAVENAIVHNVDVDTVMSKVKMIFSENTKYDIDAVRSLSEAINPTNATFLDAALDILKTNRNVNYGDILHAMSCINEQNLQFALSILKNKNVYPLAWGAVLKNADDITIPEFQALLKNKAFCQKHLMDLEYINKDNIDLYKMYYNDERFSGGSYKLTNLLAPVNQYNKSYLRTVLEQCTEPDASFTVGMQRILKSIDNDLKKEMAEKILPPHIKDIKGYEYGIIENLISGITERNKTFLSNCIDSNKFSISELGSIMNIYNIDMSVRPDVLKTNRLLEQLNNLSDDARRALVSDGLDLSAIEKYLKGEYTVMPTTSGGRTQLFKNVIANNNENALLTTDFSASTNNGVKEIIDDICSGLPEFRAIANSPQGVKTLQTLQNFMKSSEYKTFSDAEKTIGKLSILLSSLKESPDAILSRYQLDNNMKSRIINIVRNNHLIIDCLDGRTSVKNVVANFRNIADYRIAEHIVKANPANSAKFTASYSQNINVAFNEFYSGQKFLFTSHILNNGRDFPTVNYNGLKVKVLNLSDMAPDEDLAKYGFPSGTTRENVTFDVHMTNNAYGTSEAQDIETLLKLSNDSFRDFAPSSTITKGNSNYTFMGWQYGVIFKNDNMNIGTLGFDSVTGTRKGGSDFQRLIFGTESSTQYRTAFMQSLERKGVSITEQEYTQLAQQIQFARYLPQIHDVKIGNRIIKADQIREAINECTDIAVGLEVTSFNPNIEALYAKVGSLDECPREFVELAAKYNLPIVLQKSNGP